MSVLCVVEASNGMINKGGFELATYGNKTAQILGTKAIMVVLGQASNVNQLGVYGADEIYTLAGIDPNNFDSQVAAKVLQEVAQQFDAKVVVVRHNANGKSVEGRLAVRLQAGAVSGVNALPELQNGHLVFKKNVFSGKAAASLEVTSPVAVISLMGNALQPQSIGDAKEPQSLNVSVPASKVKVIERKTISGKVPLPEAEIVVSAGRGMGGPEKWGIIEELADALGATTACSRPIADSGWRPHHEHVGQTGVAIRPNLYIAAGISGAIQHLAGVNSSKVIVVINKDPEAPFFKAADYGVVGDLFEVVPKLTEAVKKFKAK